ncbi:MAG: hypothetical protein QM820_21835 [Minicystis sp.]
MSLSLRTAHPVLFATVMLACGSGGATHGESGTTTSTTSSTGNGGAGGLGGAGTTTTGSGASTSTGQGGQGGSLPVDPCAGQSDACPTVPVAGYSEGDGLRAVNRCAFPMKDQDHWAASDDLIARLAADLPPRTIGDVTADLNRTADPITAAELPGSVASMKVGFGWQSGDESVAYWIPQGITGSGDAASSGAIGGKKLLLVSWYYDQAKDPGSTVEKGVRLALVDVTDPASIHYRFLLLVAPLTTNGHVTFQSVPIHAGGLAWYGNLLYVADTTNGFRVFDTSRIFEVPVDQDLIGYQPGSGKYYAHTYKYILPQVDRYLQQSSCSPRFSFVSIDHSTDPPSLVSGEYDDASIYGRLYRFALDPSTHRIKGPFIHPEDAWHAGQSHVQGALAHQGKFLLSSSKPAGAAGILYRTSPDTASKSFGWVDAPEDLSFDPSTGRLWCLSEGLGARYVFATALTAYIP